MTDKCLSPYDRDGLRNQAEKREADKQRKLNTWDDLLTACEELIAEVADYKPGDFCLEGDVIASQNVWHNVKAAIAKARGHDAGGE